MSVRILLGDVREKLAELPDESVHCVVTSPPYFGLRDYGVAGQIGLEPTPAEFVAVMVDVFREVRRVLRKDGTLWLNLGDSYAASTKGAGGQGKQHTNAGSVMEDRSWRIPEGLKAKDLIGVPWRVAFALQADGWYLRQDIIWSKPNPMPESVTDRCTKSHEYLFLLTRSARYHYDAEAIAEALTESSVARLSQDVDSQQGSDRVPGKTNGPMKAVSGRPGGRRPEQFDEFVSGAGRSGVGEGLLTRNRRSVWTVATQPLKSAVSYGKYRIGSRDCSVHDYRADRSRVLECDAQQDVFRFARNPGNGARPVQLPEGAVVSIPADPTAFPSDVTSAIVHSIANRKNGSSSEQDVICGDIPGGHSGCREFLGHLFATSARILANNTAPDSAADGLATGPSAETECRIVGIATFEDRPSGCSCYYAGKVEKRQDHFASFPPDLIEPCIKAGCPKDCCAKCGAPVVRQQETVVESSWEARKAAGHKSNRGGSVALQVAAGATMDFDKSAGGFGTPKVMQTTGWSPSCTCDAGLARGVCLDPFGGAGTTGLVADRLQRDAILIELNPEYAAMAEERLRGDAPLFAEVAL